MRIPNPQVSIIGKQLPVADTFLPGTYRNDGVNDLYIKHPDYASFSLNKEQVGASALGAILNRVFDLKQESVIFAPRAGAPTSIVRIELISVLFVTSKQYYLWKLAEACAESGKI